MKRIPKTDKVLLMILDGWGISEERKYNAVYQARTPNYDRYSSEFPFTQLEASGKAVGLPEGQMGNSEVGHLTLGAGRVIYQPLVRISTSIEQGEFFRNDVFRKGMLECRSKGGTLHLIGLTSFGGVHSHMDHLYALLEMALEMGLERVRVHAITDGRDVSPRSSLEDIKGLIAWLDRRDRKGRIRIATIMGRFWAMDRDRRWERIMEAYEYYTIPKQNAYQDPLKAIKEAYDKGETDEFISPLQIVDPAGQPNGLIMDEDTVIFFNFRPDRARQITKAFIYPFFDGFVREKVVRPHYIGMTDYDNSIFTHVAYPEEKISPTLGEIVSQEGIPQLRIAETEKYAHVTFFFSGGREEPFQDEKRILVPSPGVKTYDMKPEMSANEVAHRAVEEIVSGSFRFGVLNFANSDMVGHTGVMEAAVKAVETVDSCMGKVVGAALDAGFHVMITADHGNSEKMWNYETNGPFTAHTTNPVPFIYAAQGISGKDGLFRGGDPSIADVASTVLDSMGLRRPPSMKEKGLFG